MEQGKDVFNQAAERTLLGSIFQGGMTQERFDAAMQSILDDMEESNAPIEECERFRRQWRGGKCPICGKPYREHHHKVTVEGGSRVLADYTYYYPSCYCEERREHQRKQERGITGKLQLAGVPEAYQHCAFDTWQYDGVKEHTSRAKANVQGWVKDQHYNGLLLFGDVGTGKTHCAVAALREFLRKGRIGQFIVTADLIHDMVRDRIDVDNVVENNDVIVMDDVDKLAVTDNAWVRERVFSTFDAITRKNKTLIMTSNIRETAELADVFGEATASRLTQSTRFIKFNGDDYRYVSRTKRGK